MVECIKCGSNSVQLNLNYTKNNNSTTSLLLISDDFGFILDIPINIESNSTENETIVSCLNCGTSWKPSVIHKLRELVFQCINLELDFTNGNHRNFLNELFIEIYPLFNDCAQEINKWENEIKTQNKVLKNKFFSHCITLAVLALLLNILYSINALLFLSLLVIAIVLSLINKTNYYSLIINKIHEVMNYGTKKRIKVIKSKLDSLKSKRKIIEDKIIQLSKKYQL